MIMNFQGLFSSSLQCHAKRTATRSVAVPEPCWSQSIICKCGFFWELLIFLTTSLQSEQNTSHCWNVGEWELCRLIFLTVTSKASKQGFQKAWGARGNAGPFCSPSILEGQNILLTNKPHLWCLNSRRESVSKASRGVITIFLHYLVLAQPSVCVSIYISIYIFFYFFFSRQFPSVG